jgi:hypothetical protein
MNNYLNFYNSALLHLKNSTHAQKTFIVPFTNFFFVILLPQSIVSPTIKQKTHRRKSMTVKQLIVFFFEFHFPPRGVKVGDKAE